MLGSSTRAGRGPAVLLAGALVVLAGCAAKIDTRRIGVVATEDANDSSPIPVELVLVKDETLLETLLALPARDWFARREQLKADFPRGFESAYFEYVPGQRVDLRRLPFDGRKGHALIVYANYRAPGEHRLRADTWKRVILRLGESGFTLEPVR